MEFTKEYTVDGGIIRGELLKDGIASFKGIPYVAPPIGDLRFKEPCKVIPWEGVKDCVAFGNSPVQAMMTDRTLWTDEFLIRNCDFSEDCLTLNLWTDTLATEKMPVIIYFYGGGFVSGGASCDIYDGTELAKRGVIYVTFNHREGVLGLFSSPELSEKSPHKTSGNYLLMDDIAAVKWVKENIAAFGGDPDNITIMGQSSGAAEVNALTVSPIAKGLFNKSISLSYNTYNEFNRPIFSREQGYEESKLVLSGSKKTLEDLESQEAMEFVKDMPIRHLTVDGYVLDKKFKEGVKEGRTNDYVTIMGAVPGDNWMGGLFTDLIMSGVRITEPEQVTSVMKDFFLTDYDEAADIYGVKNKPVAEIVKALDEDFLITSMLYFAKGRQQAGANKATYIYYYTHVLPGPMADKFGAFHSCEVPYCTCVFSDLRKDYWKEEDYKLGDAICTGLADFAKLGKPEMHGFVPCDGTNYFRIEAGKSRNVVFDEKKLKLWFEGFKNNKKC